MSRTRTGSITITGGDGGNTIVPAVTLKFETIDGSGEMDSIVKASGSVVTLPECTFTAPTDKEFDTWQVNGDEYAANSNIVLTDDTVAYALWRNIKKTVTFDANGHGTAPQAQTVDYGAYASVPATPDDDGYYFIGWYRDADCSIGWAFEEPVTEDITLYANWTPKNFNIFYILGGGTNNESAPEEYTVESGDITIPEPTKAGHTFIGWTYDGQDEPTKTVVIPGDSTGDWTLTANWQINKYTLTFDTQGGTAIDPMELDYDEYIYEPLSPTKELAVFNGWDNLPDYMPAENVTATAKWLTLEKHDAHQGGCTEYSNIEYYYCKETGGYYILSDPDRYEYTKSRRSEIFSNSPGHSYDFDHPVWTWFFNQYFNAWEAQVRLDCTKCGDYYVWSAGNIDSAITKEPTETEDGERTYTASIYIDDEHTLTDTKTEVIPKTHVVAKIGDTEYSSLKPAIEDANTGDVIVLVDDAYEPEENCYRDYVHFTIDLNGHTATYNNISVCGSLTIKNGTLNSCIYNSDTDLNETLMLDNAQLYISTGKPFFTDETKNAKALIAANADRKGEIDMLDVIKILQISKENKNA